MRTIKDLQHQNKNQELVILERQDERLYNQIFELENTLSFNSKTALKWFNYPRFRLYGILRSNRVVGIVAATQDYSMPYRNALEESTSIMCFCRALNNLEKLQLCQQLYYSLRCH